jgi:hypothetical protein
LSQGRTASAAPSATPKEPRFLERLAHLRGKLVYPEGSPAPHLPVAIENGCEMLAGFTDSRGRFTFEDVALPARLRSLESFRLWSGREDDEVVDEVLIEPSSFALSTNQASEPQPVPNGATRELAFPIVLQGPAIVYLANYSGTRDEVQFMDSIDLLSMGPARGSVIVGAEPQQVELARKLGFIVAVVAGDGNQYVVDADKAPSEEAWDQTLRGRVKAAQVAWKLAELGASRAPRSRVRVDAACVKRASAGAAPRSANEQHEP